MHKIGLAPEDIHNDRVATLGMMPLHMLQGKGRWQNLSMADRALGVVPILEGLFDLILNIPPTILELRRDGFSWVEPVLS